MSDSLAVALGCGPSNVVYITDQQPMIALMRRNIALNDLDQRVIPSVYDWGDVNPQTIPSQLDVVLAGRNGTCLLSKHVDNLLV